MNTRMAKVIVASTLLAMSAGTTVTASDWNGKRWNNKHWDHEHRHGKGHGRHGSHDPFKNRSFKRIATFANYLNNGDARFGEETVSEIVAATRDGKTLVYTDGTLQQVGFIDISDPANPVPAGTVAVGGEPTSVDVLGNTLVLVAVNTSPDLTAPSGELVVIAAGTGAVVGSVDLGGQPDSIKISPDGRYVAIAIENERNEDIEVPDEDSGELVEGGLPQLPAGRLAIVDIIGDGPTDWIRRDVDLSGLAGYGADDPEPEFVDVNDRNHAVISLQENNHIVVVDLVSGEVIEHFDAGTVSLDGIDATEDDVIVLGESLADIPREPDAITWVPLGRHGWNGIATANEGDLFGGSRGFSLFSAGGQLLFDSGESFEALAVRHGHYPEARSENKGSEPEAIEFARYDRDDYLFVGSERGSFVAVYEMRGNQPEFRQLLPAPLGPEGLLAIPSRDLLVVSGEEDDPGFGVRSSVMIYRLERGQPTYPQLISANLNGSPIPWSALSGMVALPGRGHQMLAVWDSFYGESNIFRIDASDRPAVITDVTTIRGGSAAFDPEGIAIAPDGTLWVASEGNASGSRPNLLIQVDTHGNVLQEVGLPAGILACRAASTATGTLGSGFEGVAIERMPRGRYRLLVAQQRGWDYTTAACEDLDDDAGGLNANGEPNRTRIWTYVPQTAQWGHIAWELAPLPANASWVGLSEITRAPDGSFVLIERDNRTGNFAELKTLVRVRGKDMADGLVSAAEKAVYDLIPDLEATNGLITDKPEGVAISHDGRTFVVTDNDGVDGWSGETWFLDLGRYKKLFR